jgi:hypothetical protein
LVKSGITNTAVDREVVEEIVHGLALILADTLMKCVELQKEVEWVLLVEKETIFQRLYLGKQASSLLGRWWIEEVQSWMAILMDGHPTEDGLLGV